MQASHAAFMLANLSLHCTWLFVKVNFFSITDGEEFWALATFERLDLRLGWGAGGLVQKAEELLTNVIGLLASSHGA